MVKKDNTETKRVLNITSMKDFEGDNSIILKEFVSGPNKLGYKKSISIQVDLTTDQLSYVVRNKDHLKPFSNFEFALSYFNIF